MKKIIFILISVAYFSNSYAQNDSKKDELFSTTTIEKVNNDTSRKNSLDLMRAVSFIAGEPADSINKSGKNIFLFYGNYKITIKNKEDYLYYLDQSIRLREVRLNELNRRSDKNQNYQPEYYGFKPIYHNGPVIKKQ